MTKTKFVLTLTIEGESLESVDDALVRAGGERLMARMTNPPTLNGKPLLNSAEKAKTTISIKEPKEVKHKAQKSDEPPTSEFLEAETASPTPVPDQDAPEVRALRAVHEKHGADGVRECLDRFGVKRVRELLPEQIEAFIQFANSKLEDLHANTQP